MKNIEIFDKQVAVIFAKLYENFPDKIDIECSKILPNSDENNKYCDGTISFLEENELISIEEKLIGNGYIGVRLTMKGLKILKQTPKSISEDKTIGEKIVSNIKDGAVSFAVNLLNDTVLKTV